MAFDTDVSEEVVETPSEPVESTEAVEEVESVEPDTDDTELEEADTEEAAEGETEQDDKPEKKGNRASDRIKQLVDERNALRAEFEQLQQQSQQPQQKQSADGAPQKPDIESFDIDSAGGLDEYFAAQADYEEQLSEWKLDQRLSQREQAKLNEQRQQQTMDDFKQAFEENPEFKENFAELQTWLADKPITADPSELYQGKELMDVLAVIAGDADLYYELADMTQTQQYAKYGQIHAQTQANKGKSPIGAKVSKAPKPPNHTKANAPIKRDPYKSSDDDVMRARGL